MPNKEIIKNKPIKNSDWELDFYSRPIIEEDGKKRWELLITSSQDVSGIKSFRWEKKCPAGEVNSLWLSEALKEAIESAKIQGWEIPTRIRCWRASMQTMIKKASSNFGFEVIASKRTYSLLEWITEREKEVYPLEKGYIAGPLKQTSSIMLNSALPLPEAIRGDAWSLASIPLEMLKDAPFWPIEFKALLPINENDDLSSPVWGLRLFSKTRALALSGWLGGLEPVRLLIEGNQLILEAGQEDRWLVSDLDQTAADSAKENLKSSALKTSGLQFISVQTTPDEQKFAGFWMLKDLSMNI